MPTESYFLDRLAHLEDQLATERLELARVQSAVAPSGLGSSPTLLVLMGVFVGATVVGFMFMIIRRGSVTRDVTPQAPTQR
jgi:hypothetical protein